MSVQIAILAAGSSSRLGSPKQLVDWHGEPLLRHLARQAHATNIPVTIILGASYDTILPTITDLPVKVVNNLSWREGMGSSIRLAVESTNANALLLMLCDQPQVSTALLCKIVSAYKAGTHTIVASQYAGILGVPALFDSALFEELSNLRGPQGAKAIIERHQSTTLGIPFEGGVYDLDTWADVEMARAHSLPADET